MEALGARLMAINLLACIAFVGWSLALGAFGLAALFALIGWGAWIDVRGYVAFPPMPKD